MLPRRGLPFSLVMLLLPTLAFLLPSSPPPLGHAPLLPSSSRPLASLTSSPSRRFVLHLWRSHRKPLTLTSVVPSNRTSLSGLHPPPHVPQQTLEPVEQPPPPPPASMESASSFLYWMLSWPKRDLLPEIRPALLLNVAWTASIVRLHQLGYVHGVDSTPHSLLSGALGFFLTFRANEGFSRCQEARKVWDSVLNTSRDIVRTSVACEPLLGQARTQRLIDLTCAFGISLESFVSSSTTPSKARSRSSKRSSDVSSSDDLIALLLTHSDRAAVESAANVPLAIVELLTVEVYQAGQDSLALSESVHLPRLLAFIDDLGHHVTSCQRLVKPAVPPVYYGHALRFLTLWSFTLPFALLPALPGMALVPAVGFVTWALFGLREIGVKTQYPFSIGLVNMRDLWKEVVWDARTCYESSKRKTQDDEDKLGRRKED